MTILYLLLAFLIIRWAVEAWRHQRALEAIPVRIHVNGSRGKSSVTRLLAAALREAGTPTMAKTTGSQARLILADGREEPVFRIGSPNVFEQVGVLRRARREGVTAIVMECMAVRPDLVRFTEDRIMKSTIGVITNVRADHLDVQGPTVSDVAMTLAGTIPRNGVAVLGEPRFWHDLNEVATARHTTLVLTQRHELPPDAMTGFRYLEHEENVATVLAVTRHLGIDDEVAVRGMHAARPDPGACTHWTMSHQARHIEFANVFAANDLESTVAIWQRFGTAQAACDTTFALLNLRGDRLDRSLQFADVVESMIRADHYVLIGDYPASVLRQFKRQVPASRLVPLGSADPAQVFDEIASRTTSRAWVGGVGNIGGRGHEVLRFVSGAGEVPC